MTPAQRGRCAAAATLRQLGTATASQHGGRPGATDLRRSARDGRMPPLGERTSLAAGQTSQRRNPGGAPGTRRNRADGAPIPQHRARHRAIAGWTGHRRHPGGATGPWHDQAGGTTGARHGGSHDRHGGSQDGHGGWLMTTVEVAA